MPELLLAEEVYEIVGAAMEVHYQLETGFLESVYQEALEIELARRSIPFTAQRRLTINYKGQPLRKEYIADLVCYEQVVVELKVIERLTNIEVAQLINYLKATQFHVGLLLNFGSRGKLEWKRYVI
jgi:GxxExxY protein